MPCKEDIKNNICVNRTLEETKAYLGAPNLMLYYNEQRFNQFEFDPNLLIKKESKIKN